MSKFLRWTGYVSTAIGFVLIILGVVGHICHKCCSAAACSMQPQNCCIHHPGLFGAAISFLVLAIALFIISDHCCCGCHDQKGGCGCGCGCGDKGECGCGHGEKGECGCGHDHGHEHEHEHDHEHKEENK